VFLVCITSTKEEHQLQEDRTAVIMKMRDSRIVKTMCTMIDLHEFFG
jgi:hypothetical protein